MSVSNNGRDAVIETFMALQRSNCICTSEKSAVNNIIKRNLARLEKDITAVCDEVLALKSNGVSNSTCVEYVILAKRYSPPFRLCNLCT